MHLVCVELERHQHHGCPCSRRRIDDGCGMELMTGTVELALLDLLDELEFSAR